jgi:hypothetical protein
MKYSPFVAPVENLPVAMPINNEFTVRGAFFAGKSCDRLGMRPLIRR